MPERLILSSAASSLAETSASDLLRSRIATLLADPGVAERVRRRLGRADGAAPAGDDGAGTPSCLRATAALTRLPVRIGRDHCRTACQSVDCLCGQYPRALSDGEIAAGRQRVLVAV